MGGYAQGDQDWTVSLHSNIYQTDPLLAGTTVELVYDPFDLQGQIMVSNAQRTDAGRERHATEYQRPCAKVSNAANDQDPVNNITTGKALTTWT